MITKENRGSGTVDILKQNLRERPQDVAQILLERAIGKNTQRLAILKRGEDMYVVTPESISVQLWFAGDFEPEVTNTLEAILKKGMVFWNIGSHIGTRVVQADALVGRTGSILAFEPTPRTKKLLDANSANRIAQIQTFPYAVGNQTGSAAFRDYGWLASGLNTAAQTSRFHPRAWKREPKYEEITVQIISVDELMRSTWLNGPDVLAIDAEGFELQIFEGAQTTLSTFKPVVVFETGDLGDSNTQGCLDNLCQLGYQFFEYRDGGLKVHIRQESYPEPGNLVAIHPQTQRSIIIKAS